MAIKKANRFCLKYLQACFLSVVLTGSADNIAHCQTATAANTNYYSSFQNNNNAEGPLAQTSLMTPQQVAQQQQLWFLIDMAMFAYKQSWNASNKKHLDTSLISEIYWGLGQCHKMKNEFRQSIQYTWKSIALDKLMGQKQVKKYTDLCQVYLRIGEMDSVVHSGLQVSPVLEDKMDSLYLKVLYINVAEAYSKKGKWDSSSLFYHKALNNWQATDSTNATFLCMLYLGLTEVSSRLGLPEQALNYVQKGLKIATLYNNLSIKIGMTSTEGSVYLMLKDTLRATRSFYQALQFGRSTNNNGAIALNAYNLSIMALREKKLDVALNYALESRTASWKTHNLSFQITAMFLMGYVYYNLKDYNTAKHYLMPAIREAEKKHFFTHLAEAYHVLAECHYKTGAYKIAYNYRSKTSALRDSMKRTEIAQRIAYMEMKYRTAEKDKILTQQKFALQRKEQEKKIWIAGASISVLFLSMLFLTLYRNYRGKQKSLVQQLKQEQEIDLLKAKVDAERLERNRIGKELHDGIVSQLLGIKLNLNALENKQDDKAQQHALHQISNQLAEATTELRSTAHNLLPDVLLKNSIISAIQTLCKNTARITSLEIDLQTYGTIPPLRDEANLSLYRIVQELVQNTVKHARASQLLVQVSYRNDILSITVEDNGIGFDEAGQDNNIYRVGLHNVRERVDALKGSMDITSVPNEETTIYMEFEKKYIC